MTQQQPRKVEERSLKDRLVILQEREAFALKKCQKEMDRRKRVEDQYRQAEKETIQLEEKIQKIELNYLNAKQRENELEEDLQDKISKAESVTIIHQNQTLILQVRESECATARDINNCPGVTSGPPAVDQVFTMFSKSIF